MPVVSRTRLRSESLALGLDGATSHDRPACWLEAEDVGAGDKGVDAFLSSFVVRCPRPGEEDRMTTGQRIGDREAAESVELTLDGELDAPNSPHSPLDGEARRWLDALRGDFVGELTGGGILIESNMAASAAFSGDIGLGGAASLVRLTALRAGESSSVSIVPAVG